MNWARVEIMLFWRSKCAQLCEVVAGSKLVSRAELGCGFKNQATNEQSTTTTLPVCSCHQVGRKSVRRSTLTGEIQGLKIYVDVVVVDVVAAVAIAGFAHLIGENRYASWLISGSSLWLHFQCQQTFLPAGT